MSLLKLIYEKQDSNRMGSWGDIDVWNLAKLYFKTREEAEEAYKSTQKSYDDSLEKYSTIIDHPTAQSPAGYADHPLQNSQQTPPIEHRCHRWIDEHDAGFFLCMSSSIGRVTDDFVKRAENVLDDKEFTRSAFNIFMDESNEINRQMEATHSVEIDLPFTNTTTQDEIEGIKQEFKRMALAVQDSEPLTPDAITRNDLKITRLKAYFDNDTTAQAFKKACKNNEILSELSEPSIREFPAAKSIQLKK